MFGGEKSGKLQPNLAKVCHDFSGFFKKERRRRRREHVILLWRFQSCCCCILLFSLKGTAANLEAPQLLIVIKKKKVEARISCLNISFQRANFLLQDQYQPCIDFPRSSNVVAHASQEFSASRRAGEGRRLEAFILTEVP